MLVGTASAMTTDYPGSSSFVRQIYTKKGITGDALEVLLASPSTNTLKEYNCTFGKWWSLCSGNIKNIY
ncbi:unnamed protein product [Acanthoscelides obtectus]|uniref:Uncharacterized protein n=1 Tax=Acanthoscelides obtectus TaxID=200917 RepID=A0A9P0MEX7_ACAOB|nr:unnamed protein product [Acanthoscelides obtectus]CAK1627597.1 hypothetical protein AOBTE_LOCUS4695 [Acanthoscelides obtectus]